MCVSLFACLFPVGVVTPTPFATAVAVGVLFSVSLFLPRFIPFRMALNAHARAWGRDDHLPELPPEPENLGGGGAGLNKFRVVGRNILTTNQLKHDADMKEMAEAMKGEKTIKELPHVIQHLDKQSCRNFYK